MNDRMREDKIKDIRDVSPSNVDNLWNFTNPQFKNSFNQSVSQFLVSFWIYYETKLFSAYSYH